ncbi:MAG TPA: hypothetical protein VIK70_04585 [Lysobacter sp.]
MEVGRENSNNGPGQRIEHGELILDVDEATRRLNAPQSPGDAAGAGSVPAAGDDPGQGFRAFKERPGSDALGDKLFVKRGPYIINPLGVPHSFQNLDDEVAELVVIFPTNVWEYVVLDHFPFATPSAKALAEEARRAEAPSQKK